MDVKSTFSRKLLLIPLLVSFFLDSIFVMNFTYADSLFLASYPSSWLTYYFFADPFITILLFFFASPFLSKASGLQSFFFIIGLIVILLIVDQLLRINIYVVPFIMALLLSTGTKLVYSIGLNAIAGAFNIRTFKEVAFYFTISGTLASILTAFTIPVVIHFFNIRLIFFVAIVGTGIIALCVLKLKPLPAIQSKKPEDISSSLYRHNFFRYVFAYTLLAMAIAALARFSFQRALIGSYSQDGLATFISLFNGSITIVGLFIQMFVAHRLLKWMGLLGILSILPLACLVVGSAITIWPFFLVLVAFAGVQSLLDDSFTSPCREIIINPFPTTLRKKASLYLRGHAAPIGGLLSAGLVLLINQYLNLHFLGITVVLLSLIWLYLSFQVNKGYRNTLHASVKENRYDPDLLSLTPENVMLMRADILQGILSDNINAQRTSLAFFGQQTVIQYLADQETQEAITKSLRSPEKDIRFKAVQALKELKATTTQEKLLHQLSCEKEDEVAWAIIDTLFHLQALPSPELATKKLHDENPYIKAIALISLDQSNFPDYQNKADHETQALLEGDTNCRVMLAILEKYLRPTPLHKKQLEALIQDKTNEVCLKAIQSIGSIGRDPNIDFVPILFDFLALPEKKYFAEKALAGYGERILDRLLAVTLSTPPELLYPAVRLLSQLNESRALEKLIELSKGSNITLRHIISSQALRYARINVTEPINKENITQMIKWVGDEISILLSLQEPQDEGLKREIHLQLRMNRQVFLHWYSLLTNPQQILTILRYIERPEQYDSNEVAKAYELLDSLAINSKLRDAIEAISREYNHKIPIKEGAAINANIIMLSTYQSTIKKEVPMNIMDKITYLRRVKLFEDIPVESLRAIAEVAKETDMAKGEYVFRDGDEPDRFYCIVSGEVNIIKGKHILSALKETDYFGELGLLDNSPRTADAIATKNGLLHYIEKQEFIHVLEDLPEIMRAIVGQIIKYLKTNLELAQSQLNNSR